MGFDVKGKTALVTGANRGIGKAIVESLLAHGAKKVYAAVRDVRSAAELTSAHGSAVEPVRLDLSEPDTIRSAAKTASDVELVINNAGVLHEGSPLDPEAIEHIRHEFEVNVLGLMRMVQAFAPVLKQNGGGAFVQLNSVVSMKAFPSVATYSASKAASYAITQTLRELLRPQGTAVLSVHPGPIATDMAATAGLMDVAEPPSLVSDGIVRALAAGEFHLFPDSMAQKIGAAYESFAKNVIEAEGEEG